MSKETFWFETKFAHKVQWCADASEFLRLCTHLRKIKLSRSFDPLMSAIRRTAKRFSVANSELVEAALEHVRDERLKNARRESRRRFLEKISPARRDGKRLVSSGHLDGFRN